MERGITRREFLNATALSSAGLLLAPRGFAENSSRAKSVIQVWLWGGAAHTDTFDPKPNAGSDYTGPLDKVIETNVPGIIISASLPELAKQADKFSLIRSMTHGVNAHETASYITQTGRIPNGTVYPCIGAVVSLFKGSEGGYKGLIPPYVVITRPQGRFSEAGFLGNKYKPFATGGDPSKPIFAVEGVVAQDISRERQLSRRNLLEKTDILAREARLSETVKDYNRAGEAAYDLILGDAGKVFDLSQEKPELCEKYGKTSFGQACLVARRLVEKGVPYVTINYEGWDTHKSHFNTMQRKLPELDKGLSSLLQDLSDRGLLESTVVWCCGEFGRTPKVQWDPPWNGGRNHYGRVFSALVAGGGFKGGVVVGASDSKGESVAERPIYPVDLLETIYSLLGIDINAKLPHPQGRDEKVLDIANIALRNGIIKELV